MIGSRALHCPRCDSDRFDNREDRIVCMNCGHSMKLEDLQLLALLDVLVEDAQATRH